MKSWKKKRSPSEEYFYSRNQFLKKTIVCCCKKEESIWWLTRQFQFQFQFQIQIQAQAQAQVRFQIQIQTPLRTEFKKQSKVQIFNRCVINLLLKTKQLLSERRSSMIDSRRYSSRTAKKEQQLLLRRSWMLLKRRPESFQYKWGLEDLKEFACLLAASYQKKTWRQSDFRGSSAAGEDQKKNRGHTGEDQMKDRRHRDEDIIYCLVHNFATRFHKKNPFFYSTRDFLKFSFHIQLSSH